MRTKFSQKDLQDYTTDELEEKWKLFKTQRTLKFAHFDFDDPCFLTIREREYLVDILFYRLGITNSKIEELPDAQENHVQERKSA